MAVLTKFWKVLKWGAIILLVLILSLLLMTYLLAPLPHMAVGKDGTSVSLIGVCEGFEQTCWNLDAASYSVSRGFNGDLIFDAIFHGSCGDLVPIEPYAEIDNESVTLHVRWHIKEGGYWRASPCRKLLRFRVPKAGKIKNPTIKVVYVR